MLQCLQRLGSGAYLRWMAMKTFRKLIRDVPLNTINIVRHNFFHGIEHRVARAGNITHGPLPGNPGSTLLIAEPSIRSKQFDRIVGKVFFLGCKKVNGTAREGHCKIRLRIQLVPDSALVDNSPSLHIAKPMLQEIEEVGAVVEQTLRVPNHSLNRAVDQSNFQSAFYFLHSGL